MKNLNRYQKEYNENGFIYPVKIISVEEAKKHTNYFYKWIKNKGTI